MSLAGLAFSLVVLLFAALSPAAYAGHILCEGENLTYHQPNPDGDNGFDGTSVKDVYHGEGGNDVVIGAGGPDKLCGGHARDLIAGGEGQDTMRGNEGDDGMWGSSYADDILGQDGHDSEMNGGPGGDDIAGAALNDAIWDGSGADYVQGGSEGTVPPGDEFFRCLDDDSDSWSEIETIYGPAAGYCDE